MLRNTRTVCNGNAERLYFGKRHNAYVGLQLLFAPGVPAFAVGHGQVVAGRSAAVNVHLRVDVARLQLKGERNRAVVAHGVLAAGKRCSYTSCRQ